MSVIEFFKKKYLVIILLMFLILVFKELISTYLSPFITLIPTIIIFFWFLFCFFNKKIKFKSYDLLYGIMIIIGIVSGIIMEQNIIAIIYQVKSLMCYYLFFVIMRSICLTDDDMSLILKIFNITTVFLVLFSIVEIIFNKSVLFPYSWASNIIYQDNYIRAYSLLNNPNLYGFFLIYVLLYNYKYGKFNVVLYILILIGIILSISRSALICLSVIILTYLINLIMRKNTKRVLYLILIVFVAIVSTKVIYCVRDINNSIPQQDISSSDKENKVDDFEDRISVTFSSNFLNESLTNGRLAVILYGFKIFSKNQLIGTGFSSFFTASSFLNPNLEDNKLGIAYADNQYIALLVETGILGFIAFCFAFGLLTLEHLKLKKYTLVLATFVIAFFGLFINCLEVQLISFLYFLYLSEPIKKPS